MLSTLLISLLIGAQTISLAHASEHDTGLSQDSCAICVGSGQLSTAAMDSGPIYVERFFGPVLCGHQHTLPATSSNEIPRQRGPPTQL